MASIIRQNTKEILTADGSDKRGNVMVVKIDPKEAFFYLWKNMSPVGPRVNPMLFIWLFSSICLYMWEILLHFIHIIGFTFQ